MEKQQVVLVGKKQRFQIGLKYSILLIDQKMAKK